MPGFYLHERIKNAVRKLKDATPEFMIRFLFESLLQKETGDTTNPIKYSVEMK